MFVITSKTAATATTSKATKAPMTINFLLLAGAGAAAELVAATLYSLMDKESWQTNLELKLR
nr:hypothetical protein [Comamonas jiangduensis]